MTQLGCLRVAMIAALMAFAAAARAEDRASDNANQVAGLFMQSCVRFAGDKDGLRNWAKEIGLQELPAAAQALFLSGLPGVVFDASNRDGKFVLMSEDGGSCSAIAESASGPSVVADLEKDMNDARMTFKVTADVTDAEEKNLKHREYLASRGEREWLLVVGTVADPAGGEAMLTAKHR